ncbi:MAG TPA: hypothetical protein DCY06_09555 [Bacteroidetes bacterium]|nr:hypothetical protein [Bacteroidota bacterium]
MPMIYEDNAGQDTFKLYYVRGGSVLRRYLARSIDFGITWNDTQLVTVQENDRQWESIIGNPDSNNYYMAFNR